MPVLIRLWDPPISPTLLGMSDHLLWERAIYHLVSCNTLFIPGTAVHQGPSLAIDSTRAVGSCVKGNALAALSFQHSVVPNSQMTLLLCFKKKKKKNQAYIPGAEVSFPVIQGRTDRWCTVRKTTKPSF